MADEDVAGWWLTSDFERVDVVEVLWAPDDFGPTPGAKVMAGFLFLVAKYSW